MERSATHCENAPSPGTKPSCAQAYSTLRRRSVGVLSTKEIGFSSEGKANLPAVTTTDSISLFASGTASSRLRWSNTQVANSAVPSRRLLFPHAVIAVWIEDLRNPSRSVFIKLSVHAENWTVPRRKSKISVQVLSTSEIAAGDACATDCAYAAIPVTIAAANITPVRAHDHLRCRLEDFATIADSFCFLCRRSRLQNIKGHAHSHLFIWPVADPCMAKR